MNPPQSPGQPDTAQPPAVITEVPQYLGQPKPIDSTIDLIQVTANLENPDHDQRLAAAREMGARREAHDRLLDDLPGIAVMNDLAEPIEVGDRVTFSKTDDGHIESQLQFAWADHNLPTPPDGQQPLALILTDHPRTHELRSAMLITRDLQGRLDQFYLEDSSVTAISTDFEPHWRLPGSARLTGSGYRLKKAVDNDDVLSVELDWYGYPGDEKPEDIRMARADLNEQEEVLLDIETPDRQRKRLKQFIGFMAGVALLAGVSHAAPSGDPLPEKTHHDGTTSNEIKRVNNIVAENFESFQKGDLATLEKKVAESEFATPMFEQADYDRVNAATNLEELAEAMNVVLKPHNIVNFGILTDTTREYSGISEGQFERAKIHAQGTLAGLANLGSPLFKDGSPFQIQIAYDVFNYNDGSKEVVDGVYIRQSQRIPIIRMRISETDFEHAIEVTNHEYGHKKDLTDTVSGEASTMNPSEFKYGDDNAGTRTVGVDIVSEYAGTDAGEDYAETLAALTDLSTQIDPEMNNTVQEKFKEVLAGLEQKYPGASAFIYANILQQKPKPADTFMENATEASIAARKHSTEITAMALTLGFLAGRRLRQNNKVIRMQQKAGTR